MSAAGAGSVRIPAEVDGSILSSSPACPVDRIPRKHRNRLCIAIIAIGAVNLVIYPITYAAIGGDARNGHTQVVAGPRGSSHIAYFIRGHHIDTIEGYEHEVSRGLWVYSYLHSISLLVTSAAMIISMLVLARPHIIATMRGGWISGPAFVSSFATIVFLAFGATVTFFTWDFLVQLNR